METQETETEREPDIESRIYVDSEVICDNCYGWLPIEEHLKQCIKCQKYYCSHKASKIDFRYCQYCFSDLVIEDSTIRKTIETKSLSGKKIFTRVMRARHIVFKGQDWMFAQARVTTMTDEELFNSIEYHREIFDQMINESEARKIAKNKLALNKMMKNSTLKIPVVGKNVNTDGSIIGMDATEVTTTTVKRTRISATSTNSPQVALAGIIAALKAQGLSQDQITAKLMSMVKQA